MGFINLLLGLISLASANNIPALDFQCAPCLAFNGYYCFDDPWKVNFNGDKCYEYAVDRMACTHNFNFTNNVTDCPKTIILPSTECNITNERFETYQQPAQFTIELDPRSSCGVSL